VVGRVLTAAAWLYGAGVRVRRWWYEHGGGHVRSLGRTVVSIGNLTVGGTGKTPLVIALGEALSARGVGVAVLSRGYGGQLERVGGMVSDGSGRPAVAWTEAGDEPALIARRLPHAVVIVGRNRVAAWSRFGRLVPREVCLLDDGFQHLAVARDADLLLIDATEPFVGAALLPRGRLREPLSVLSRASAVVITRADQASPDAVDMIERYLASRHPSIPVFYARFVASSLLPVGGGAAVPVDRLKRIRVLAVAGIGRFESFRALVDREGATIVETIQFRDHHPYRAVDLDRIRTRARASGADLVVTTEKDAIKMETLVQAGEPLWAVRIDARVEAAATWNAWIDRIVRAVA